LNETTRVESKPKTGFEPWAKAGFGVCALAAALTGYLAMRPGGEGPIRVYGLWFVPGLLAAGLFMFSLVWGLLHRPLLQRGRLKGWIALAVCLWWSVFPFPFPSSHEGHPSLVAFELPFDGEWEVIFAGHRYRQNPLVLRAETRFGVGLRRAGEAEILAPVDAVLLAVEPVPGDGSRVTLVLEVARLEILELRGVLRESTRVSPGDSFSQGASLGRTDRLDVYLHDPFGEGKPIRFHGFIAQGRRVEKAELRVGQTVSRDQEIPRRAAIDTF